MIINIPDDVATAIAAESPAFCSLLLQIVKASYTTHKAISVKFLPESPSPFAWLVYQEVISFGKMRKIEAIKRLREWYHSNPNEFWQAGIYSGSEAYSHGLTMELIHAKNIIEAWIP